VLGVTPYFLLVVSVQGADAKAQETAANTPDSFILRQF
jgi:hypothetical protein